MLESAPPPPPVELRNPAPKPLTSRELRALTSLAREGLASGIAAGKDLGIVGELANTIKKAELNAKYLEVLEATSTQGDSDAS